MVNCEKTPINHIPPKFACFITNIKAWQYIMALIRLDGFTNSSFFVRKNKLQNLMKTSPQFPIIPISIILLAACSFFSCEKEEGSSGNSEPAKLSGIWNVDSTLVVSSENGNRLTTSFSQTIPHTFNFSILGKVVQRKIQDLDTADFLYVNSYTTLSDLDFNGSIDTTLVNTIIPNVSVELELNLHYWLDTINNVEYKTTMTHYLSKL